MKDIYEAHFKKLLLLLVNDGLLENYNSNQLKKSFYKDEIVPDVLSSIPEGLLEIKFKNRGQVVIPGEKLSKNEIRFQPEVRWKPVGNKMP